MKIKKCFCFFEQSGTFKKAFQRNGVSAFDVDIKNNFGETDFCIDLFREIKAEENGEKTIFSEITPDDLIFAFFPCTRFSARVPLNARGEGAQMKGWSVSEKLNYSSKVVKEIAENYEVLCLLVELCLQKGLRLVVENPYTQPHFLTLYFPVKPAFIDTNRSGREDFFKKPTQFFFINCEPENNFVLKKNASARKKNIENVKTDGVHTRQECRSLISEAYANNFLKEFILEF